jgi:hypothetical protein
MENPRKCKYEEKAERVAARFKDTHSSGKSKSDADREGLKSSTRNHSATTKQNRSKKSKTRQKKKPGKGAYYHNTGIFVLQ